MKTHRNGESSGLRERLLSMARALGVTVLLVGCQSMPPGPVQKTVSVNGATLSYIEQGTGLPVVFLHGGITDQRAWEPQRQAVAGKYRFVALSMRYFGTVPWPDAGTSFSQTNHVADLAAFIRELKLGPVVLAGWSYGGSTAVVTALRHPDLVRGLFVNEPPLLSTLTSAADRAMVAQDLQGWAPIREELKAGRNHQAAKLFADWANNQPGYFDAMPAALQTMVLDNARTLPLQLTQTAPVPVSCEQLGQLQVPAVVTRGELGMAHLRAVAQAVSGCLPKATLITFSGARHGANIEMPERFNEALLAFLADL
jgi:pimeloyl-ACP methyl ester carboxylesterase